MICEALKHRFTVFKYRAQYGCPFGNKSWKVAVGRSWLQLFDWVFYLAINVVSFENGQQDL